MKHGILLSLQAACRLYSKCIEKFPDHYQLLKNEDNPDPVENIHIALSGVSHSIESRLPRNYQEI